MFHQPCKPATTLALCPATSRYIVVCIFVFTPRPAVHCVRSSLVCAHCVVLFHAANLEQNGARIQRANSEESVHHVQSSSSPPASRNMCLPHGISSTRAVATQVTCAMTGASRVCHCPLSWATLCHGVFVFSPWCIRRRPNFACRQHARRSQTRGPPLLNRCLASSGAGALHRLPGLAHRVSDDASWARHGRATQRRKAHGGRTKRTRHEQFHTELCNLSQDATRVRRLLLCTLGPARTKNASARR